MRAALLPAALAAIATMPSCSSIECGPGTFRSGDNCVDYDPHDKTPPTTTITPAGGRSRAPLPVSVMLQTDEPAQIYYTTDGTDPDPSTTMPHRDQTTIVGITQGMTIKFFAIDLAGNREDEQTVTFDSDTTAPAQVSNLAVTLTGGNTAHVTWTPPTTPDYAGTVLARVTELVDASPVPGTLYTTSPMMLSGNLEIVSTGTATSFDDPGRSPGPVRYVAWTYDDLGNYSAPVAASNEVSVGSLNATLTFNTASSTLSVTAAPANLDLTGTTATLSAGTLTITLMVKNKTTKYFQNPKAEVTSVTNATFANSDGNADTFPFRTLGPNMLAPGATASVALQLTGVTAGSNPTINLTFASHPAIIGTYGGRFQASYGVNMIDIGSGAVLPALMMTTSGPNNRGTGKPRGAVLLGGHLLAVPTTHGVIELFDLATRTHVSATPLGNANQANIQSLVWTGADLIAVIKYAGNRHAGMVDLVRLDEKLHVTAENTLMTVNDDTGFGRPGLSPDGQLLAIPASGGVLLVAAPTLTPLDADPTTPDLDLFDPGISGRLGSIVFADNQRMLVLAKQTGQAAVMKPDGNGGYTATAIYSGARTSQDGFSAAASPDGKIWFALNGSIRAYDPATDTVAQVTAYTNVSNGLASVAGAIWIMRSDHMTLDQVSTTGAIQKTVTLPTQSVGANVCSPSCNGLYGHWLDTAR